MKNITIPFLTSEQYREYTSTLRLHGKKPKFIGSCVRTVDDATGVEEWSDTHYLQRCYLHEKADQVEISTASLYFLPISFSKNPVDLKSKLIKLGIYQEFSSQVIVEICRGLSQQYVYGDEQVILFLEENRNTDNAKCYAEFLIRNKNVQTIDYLNTFNEDYHVTLVRSFLNRDSLKDKVCVLGKLL